MIDLRLGDCLALLPTLEAQSIDAVIADIPYGTTACKWDTVIPFDPMWEQLKRVAKPKAAIVLFGSQPFTSALVMSNPKWFRHEWIWQKNKGNNFATVRFQPFKEHESVVVFSRNGMTYKPQLQERAPSGRNRLKYSFKNCYKYVDKITGLTRTAANITEQRQPSSVQKFTCEMGFHPTQKPVALMEYLIRTYTNEGDTVLDFTMGSGTTIVACVKTKRNGIGFEILPEYFEIAKKRIAEAQQQMVLL